METDVTFVVAERGLASLRAKANEDNLTVDVYDPPQVEEYCACFGRR